LPGRTPRASGCSPATDTTSPTASRASTIMLHRRRGGRRRCQRLLVCNTTHRRNICPTDSQPALAALLVPYSV
jgi:hypothetical protein